MKKLKNLLLIFVTVFLTQSCFVDVFNWHCDPATGDIIEQQFFLDPFDKISLEISATVYISRGPEQSVIVEAPESVMRELRTNVRNNEWDISLRDCIKDNNSTTIYITLPYLEGIDLRGSGDVIVQDTFEGNDFSLNISGSGLISGIFEGNVINSTVSGSGEINLAGTVLFQEVRISGSGNVNAFDLFTEESKVVISGSGNSKVSTTDLLDVRISGSGDILYRGNPQIVSRITGSGRIIDAN